MIHVKIKDLKNGLSSYLAMVKKGDELIVTERGNPIARIVRESVGNDSTRRKFHDLMEKGLITMPSKVPEKEDFEPIQTGGKTASNMVIEDRR